jgi:hypothetical protein
MKVIASEFIKSGFNHKVLERRGMVLLVERQHRDVSVPHWEVVKIRVSPAKCVGDRAYTESEVYPSSERWGTDGWTYSTLEAARAKFDSLSPLLEPHNQRE